MLKRTVILAALVSLVSADLLKPANGSKQKEILTISENRRVYYDLESDPLTYLINGPVRLKIYSRSVYARKTSESQRYNFTVRIDEGNPINIQHTQRITTSVKSSMHPNHYYSRSAIDYLNIPAGPHEVHFYRDKKSKPTLIRVLEIDLKPEGSKKRLEPLEKATPVSVQANGKSLRYFELSNDNPLYVQVDGPTNFEVITRLAFQTWMGREQDYRLQVWDNGKLAGTFYFSGERSEVSTVAGRDDLVPGKWRSCYIPITKGQHKLKIKLLDNDRSVYVRMNRID